MKTGKYVVNQVNILYQVQVAGKYGFKLGDCCANNPNLEIKLGTQGLINTKINGNNSATYIHGTKAVQHIQQALAGLL
mgnify:CR=1 FL=1